MLGYMGPDGTFTQQAAIEWSGGREELREFPTIASAIKAVATGEIERCIVPVSYTHLDVYKRQDLTDAPY